MKLSKIILLLALCVWGLSCSESQEAMGDRLVLEREYDQAICCFQNAIYDGSISAMSKLGLLYSNLHKPEKAKAYFQMAFENGDVQATKMLGAMSFRDEKYEEAVAYYRPLGDDGDKEVAYNLGSSLFALKKYDEALKYLKLNEENVAVKNVMGLAYYEKGDKVNAEKYWKSAVDDYKSGAINSHRNLLNLYQEQGRMDDYHRYENKY